MDDNRTFTLKDYDKAVKDEIDSIIDNPDYGEDEKHGTMMFVLAVLGIAANIRKRMIKKEEESEEQ